MQRWTMIVDKGSRMKNKPRFQIGDEMELKEVEKCLTEIKYQFDDGKKKYMVLYISFVLFLLQYLI